MKSFKQHMVITEAGPTGAEYESIIAVGYNQGTPPYSSSKAKDSGAFSTAKKFLPKDTKKPYNDTAYKLGQAMKSKTSGVMKQAGSKKEGLSSFWTQITGKGVDTSKTDVITKDKISLKKKGGSQLMSASRYEAMATLLGGLEMVGENNQIVDIVRRINNDFDKFLGKSVTSFRQKKGEFANMKPAEYAEKNEKLLGLDKMHNELSDSLSQALDGKKNKNIKEAITYIATTGYKKFPKNSDAIADKLIEFDPVKGTITHNITTGSPASISAGIKSMAAKTTYYVNFKTSKKNPYSALRTKTKTFAVNNSFVPGEYNPTLNGLIIETLMEDLNVDTQSLLNEGYAFFTEEKIIEGLLDKAKAAIQKLGRSVSNWFRNIISKIIEGAKKVFDKVKNLGEKAFEVLFDFLGVEISNAKVRVSGIAGGFANK